MMEEILNFNIGMLGHVDSGKTSLAKALSSISSTAAFDKNPQSRERGITLDLGFSSFSTTCLEHLEKEGYKKVQYTLVDCPGHASLIKTVIGGAQIIDLMILVVDITKGIQTQTAECLVIGEIICPKILVVLNKIDLIAENKRKATIEKMSKRILKTLEKTKFKGLSSVVAVSADPSEESPEKFSCQIEELIQVLKKQTYKPSRSTRGPFVFSVDHCFSIRGQGTVLTGTVLSGKISLNETVEIASLKMTKKVKSIQMFHKSVDALKQGDRGACCVTQFDPKLLERGLVCTPGSIPMFYAVIGSISKIPYYSAIVKTKSKFHISIGHSTVMATVSVFSSDQSLDLSSRDFDFNMKYKYEDVLQENSSNQFALFEFEKAVMCPHKSLMIGSRLDVNATSSKCRLAFKAEILFGIEEKEYLKVVLPRLQVYKNKCREGIVDRLHDNHTVICKNLMKKETNIEAFIGLKVELSSGERGYIHSSFGLSGKTKIYIPDGLKPSTLVFLENKGSKKKGKKNFEDLKEEKIKVSMNFKRFVYDPSKSMQQN